jgi:arylsulfatase A
MLRFHPSLVLAAVLIIAASSLAAEAIEDHPGEGVTNPETQGAHWRKGLAAPGWKFDGYLSTIAGKADAWLTEQSASGGKEPFFLYYAIPAPHAPWATASEFKGKSGAGQYGDYVMNVDAMIGQVLATLDKLKLKENTLIFFSSDNGPVWYPQDIEKFGHRAAGPWSGMKGALTVPDIACRSSRVGRATLKRAARAAS